MSTEGAIWQPKWTEFYISYILDNSYKEKKNCIILISFFDEKSKKNLIKTQLNKNIKNHDKTNFFFLQSSEFRILFAEKKQLQEKIYLADL